jgi:SpoVK/Ycf46/Vps4 family AAA+-type ATPase
MDHEVNSQMKTQFMCLWDGFATSDDNIIILGATNRPQDLDPAIVRRLPLRFEVPLPGETDRADILRIILSEEGVTDGIDYAKIAKGMRGMSGSDIKEVCRSAALSSLQRALNEMNAGAGIQHPEITEADLTDAVTKSTPVPKGLPSLSTIPSHILLD